MKRACLLLSQGDWKVTTVGQYTRWEEEGYIKKRGEDISQDMDG